MTKAHTAVTSSHTQVCVTIFTGSRTRGEERGEKKKYMKAINKYIKKNYRSQEWFLWLHFPRFYGLEVESRTVRLRIFPFANNYILLGSFAKSREVTIGFVMSVCPRGTTPLPTEGFSRNFIFEYFSKICRENSSLNSSQSDKFSDKSCTDNQNISCSKTFCPENTAVGDNVEKFCRGDRPRMAIRRMLDT